MPNKTTYSNLCLLVHCLRSDTPCSVNRELFIDPEDLEDLVINLQKQGYRFVLPTAEAPQGAPICSFTFDDGYFNNRLFLNLAEKYNIPFILFVVSYNISHEIPFIWDIWNATRKEKWRFSSVDYENFYDNLGKAEKNLLYNDAYRPFTECELEKFASHPLVHLGLHTHTHQPLVGRFAAGMDLEVTKNLSFLKRFPQVLEGDLSLPCGLYTHATQKMLLKRFQRIYTIDGGGVFPSDRIIHRISLVNPEIGGPLVAQIARSFRWKTRLRRKLANIRYSHPLTYRL